MGIFNRLKSMTLDGWANALTGLGDPMRDKRLASIARTELLDHLELTEMYRGSWLAARGIDLIVNEMHREWLDVEVNDDEEQGEGATTIFEELGAREKFEEAIKWKRLYGGSLLLMNVQDGANYDMPVRENAIQSIDSLASFDSSEAWPIEWQNNPTLPGYGEPSYYQITPRVMGVNSSPFLSRVHSSRVLRFNGITASRWHVHVNRGWGDSVLDRAWNTVRDHASSHDGTSALMQDMGQAVFRMRGLANALSSDKKGLITERIKLMDMTRSILRATILDADGEEFDRKATPLAGVSDALEAFSLQVAAAFDTPLIRLMGSSPGGLGSNGNSEAMFWYDTIKAHQGRDISPNAQKLARLIFLSKAGPTGGKEPDKWSLKFRPLWQLTEGEQADLQLKQATADEKNISLGVLTADEVRTARFKGSKFSIATQVDDSDVDAIDPNQPTPRIDPATGEPIDGATGSSTNKVGGMTNGLGGLPTGGEAKAQDTALNGAQMASALEIVVKVTNKEIPRDSGVAMLTHFLNITPEDAETIMGKAGAGFEPTPPEPQIVAAPPGGKPPAPGKKPPAIK